MNTTDKRLQLERWCSFHEGDGYLRFTYTDSGGVTLCCGKDESIPGERWEDCGHPEHEYGNCKCPSVGYIGEFTTHAVKEGSTVPLGHGQHVWAFGVTFDEMIEALFDKVMKGDTCGCRSKMMDRLEEAERMAAAVERGELETFPIGPCLINPDEPCGACTNCTTRMTQQERDFFKGQADGGSDE